MVKMYAVLDLASENLIRKDLADYLHLTEAYQLSLNTVENDAKTQRLNRVNFSMSSKDHADLIPVNGA